MHSYSNTYETLLDHFLIQRCFYDSAKGKTCRRDIKPILENLQPHIDNVLDILNNESFEPYEHKPKIINEFSSKKTRVIIEPHYKYEQVIHHIAMAPFQEMVVKRMYPMSCGNIKGRGIKYCDRYVQKAIRKYHGRKFYVLKMDIRHYYDSIDRNILKAKIRKLYKDDRYYNLLCKIIDYDKNPNGKGIPLGYYPSQWFGNFYLIDFDYFVKQELGAEHYFRYVDDLVIFGKSKKLMHKMRRDIAVYLSDKLHLALKDDWQVYRFEYFDSESNATKGRPLNFLGYIYHHNRKTLRKSLIFRARRKAVRMKHPNWYNATQMISYLGWFKHSDTYGYFQKYIVPYIKPKKLKTIVSKHSRRKLNNAKINRSNLRQAA